MRTTYRFGDVTVDNKEFRWMLSHLGTTGPSTLKGSAFVFERGDGRTKEKVRVLEADVIQYVCRKLEELGSGYW